MPYRIITFDGGGVRGVYTAVLLNRLVQKVPDFLDSVDFFSGTSTGGIIAMGLAYGLNPSELLEFYNKKAREIFSSPWLDVGAGITRAKYDNLKLRNTLVEIFGNTRLRQLKKRVLIPTLDLDNEGRGAEVRMWKPKFFHNFPGPDSDGKEKIVDVVMRTTAAPSFFPSFHGYIDGGVVANNPSMTALAQALDTGTGGQALSDIHLFSLGTGVNPQFIRGDRLDWGIMRWAKPIVHVLADGIEGVADYECRRLLDKRYYRLSPVLPKAVAIDEVRKMKRLAGYAQRVNLTGSVRWLRKNFV